MAIVYDDDKPAKAGSIVYDEPPDQYQQAAIDERDRMRARGSMVPGGNALSNYTRRLTQGAGMGWTDEAMAGLMTIPETVKQGVTTGNWSPAEAYKYSRARELLSLEDARRATGATGSALEILGGLATGGRAVVGALPRAGAATEQAAGFWPAVGRYGGNVGKGAVIGGIAGAGDAGDTFADRFTGAAVGGLTGGLISAAAPAVLGGIGYAAQPLKRFLPKSANAPVSNVDDVALDQLSKTMQRSGKTGQQIEREVLDANAAGQPYILAEGIGTEGQRKLAAIAKTPGAARQWIDKDLGARDLERGLRAGQAVDTGMGVPPGMTAEMAQDYLTRQARARSAPFYAAAEAKQPTWTPRMQEFFDDPDFGKALKAGFKTERQRALADGRPFRPHDYAITQFDEAGDPIMSAVPNMKTIDLMKRGIDTLINKYRDPVTRRVDTSHPEVVALDNMRKAFLREVDSINPMYGRARAEYAGPAQIGTAVDRGRDLPLRGRPEDTIPKLARLPATEQQGVRIGVADRIAEQLSKGTETGPLPAYLRNNKGRQELDYLSLHQGPRQPLPPDPLARASDPVRFQPDPMRRALDRETTMRQTYTQARGGSATAENAADMADNLPPAVDPVGVMQSLLGGNFVGAAKALVPAGKRVLGGESEAQRTAMARMLMERDPAELSRILQSVADLQARRTAAATGRSGGLAEAGVAGTDADENLRRRITRVYIHGR